MNPIIYGPFGNDLAYVRKKTLVENWIARTLRGDAAIGRMGKNFAEDPTKAFPKKEIARLNSIGVRVYCGSGNVFLADLKGPNPKVIQRRPLAQRFVELCTE
mgnify:CR=1 FL=1